MSKYLDWSKIKDDFKGFEELAYEFVMDKYPHPDWTKTKDSWDGNKDAYTIVFGFQPYPLKSEQWWMEAKYSKKSQKTHRYRLDATIVSAIVAGNISKVIFVTNTIISAKTIIDIRSALKNAINCKNVDFCSKYTMEHWLQQNPDVFSRFFPDAGATCFALTSIFVTEELEFYSDASNKIAFREPLQTLENDGRYYGYCSVFCNHKATLKLKLPKKSHGISIIGNRKVELFPGENVVKIVFDITMDFEKEVHGKYIDISMEAPVFLLGDIELVPKYFVPIIEKSFPEYTLKTQQDIMNQLRNDISEFVKRNTPTVDFLLGNSGVGKSFIIRNIINSKSLEDTDIFLINMSHSDIENEKAILHLILFILFPYVNAESIDSEYIDDIISKGNHVSNFVRDAIHHKNDPDELHRLISKTTSEYAFLTGNIHIGRRVIIIDNFHKAGIVSNEAILNIIEEVYSRKLPVFILISSQPQFYRTYFYEMLETVSLREYKLELTIDDLTGCIKSRISDNIEINALTTVLNSAIEIFLFVRFLDDFNPEIKSLGELKAAFATFFESRILEEYILNLFNEAFTQMPKVRELCLDVYWKSSGIHMAMSPELEFLYERNLVRQEPSGEIVPYHDQYAYFFRKHYSRPVKLISNNPLEHLRNIFSEYTPSDDSLESGIEAILSFEKERKYYSIHFILDDIFTNKNHQMLKNAYGKQNYYTLYMAYALANTHLGTRTSGRELFSKIYNETNNDSNAEIRLICKKALWELTNSRYEWLEFDIAKEYADKLISLTKCICKYDPDKSEVRNDINYHDAQVIKALIASELCMPNRNSIFERCCNNIKDAGFVYRYHSFRLRYALTLMANDGKYAHSLIEECRDIFSEKWGEGDKYYLWAAMGAEYMKTILNNDLTNLDNVLLFQEKLKQHHYNDYRKSLLALASYFYSNCDISYGNNYLVRDSHIFRKLRTRQQGFYHETIALHDTIQGNTAGALENLSVAHKIFMNIPSYSNIVVHNMELLHKGMFNKNNIQYCVDGNMGPDVYYVDPRCIW